MKGFDWDKQTELKNNWFSIFDELVKLIEDNGGCLTVDTPIYDFVKIERGIRRQMRLHSMTIRTGLLIDKHIVLEYTEDSNGELKEVLVSRAFEAKSFGDIRYTNDCLKFILKVLKLTYQNKQTTMAKVELYKKGAMVSTKKLNGEPLLAIYEHGYDNGHECCVIGADEKKYCVKLRSTKPANDEEQKIIQETIVKPRREAEKKRKAALAEQEETLTEEDMEEAAEPTEEELEEAMNASETVEEDETPTPEPVEQDVIEEAE